jgi:hypothetical protein
VDSAGQVGDYSKCTETFQEALVNSLGPGTKSTSNLELKEKKNLHQTSQNPLKLAKN